MCPWSNYQQGELFTVFVSSPCLVSLFLSLRRVEMCHLTGNFTMHVALCVSLRFVTIRFLTLSWTWVTIILKHIPTYIRLYVRTYITTFDVAFSVIFNSFYMFAFLYVCMYNTDHVLQYCTLYYYCTNVSL